jgi:hypothetical protein
MNNGKQQQPKKEYLFSGVAFEMCVLIFDVSIDWAQNGMCFVIKLSKTLFLIWVFEN